MSKKLTGIATDNAGRKRTTAQEATVQDKVSKLEITRLAQALRQECHDHLKAVGIFAVGAKLAEFHYAAPDIRESWLWIARQFKAAQKRGAS